MSVLPKAQLVSNIQSELSDNNAGLISAYNVRHNMQDIVESVNQLVASGDFDGTTPFTGSSIRAKITNGSYGMFIAESGINFPNGGGTQYVAYPGPLNISHNDLSNLSVGDPHTQYMSVDGTRVMQNNLGTKNNWINSSGNSVGNSNNRGLQFTHTPSTNKEVVHIGTGTKLTFDVDNSNLNTGKSVARAWINFSSSSGNLTVVNDSHNIYAVQKLGVGKHKIVFASGTLASNSYVAIGSSNSRSASDTGEDFDHNTVGLVYRTGDDASALRSVTFYVINGEGKYTDAKINDLVVFGREFGTTTGIAPIIS